MLRSPLQWLQWEKFYRICQFYAAIGHQRILNMQSHNLSVFKKIK